jgi:hypothetical protein
VTVEYKRHDVLEHVADNRRVKIVSASGPRIVVQDLATRRKNGVSRETLRKEYANLTAQEEKRYVRV